MNKANSTSTYQLVERWANILVAIGIISVLIPTLFPYDFFFQEVWSQLSQDYLRSRIARPDDLVDFVANIFLFIPFGFGFSCLIRKLKLRAIAASIAVLIASFGLTWSVEFLQIFLPSRHPSYVDLTTNTIGGLIGFLVFELLGIKLLAIASAICRLAKGLLSKPVLIFLAIAYVCFIYSLSPQFASKLADWQLSNWDVNFPLVVGNERTGDRPWLGEISQLCLSDRAATTTEVSRILENKDSCQAIANSFNASYHLKGTNNYPDTTGQLPNLTWHQKIPMPSFERGITFTPANWLHTEQSIAINEKIKNSSQFTISSIIASNDQKQNGPARIISISTDIYSRNLTLGQWGENLSIRLRTPFTGSNGTRAAFVVPKVFSDRQFHHLVITYDGQLLSAYIDSLESKKALEFNQENAVLFSLSPPFPFELHLNLFHAKFYQFLFYALIFSPLLIVFSTLFNKSQLSNNLR
jgi:glycopeptide antibiotics resistance protein